VFCRASVAEILRDLSGKRATGVRMRDGTVGHAPMVVSSAGFLNTFTRLVPRQASIDAGVPLSLDLHNSEGFVMLNFGLRGTKEQLKLKGDNLWIHPVDPVTGDIFGPLLKFYEAADPLQEDMPTPPLMVTFPTLKNRSWPHEDRHSCQVLCMANWSWFAKYESDPVGKRSDEYMHYKQRWTDRIMTTMYRHFPQFEGAIDHVDTSSPLSIAYYLNAPGGSATGLEQSPRRYTDPAILAALDIRTPIRGLYMTGQDTAMCGVAMAQISGVLTALVAGGPLDAARFIAKTAFCM